MKKPVLATVHSFPKKALLTGIKTNYKHLKEKPEDYYGIKLCNYKKTNGLKDMWWIYYGDVKDNPNNYSAERRLTGHFKSRKEAVAWFTGGGR